MAEPLDNRRMLASQEDRMRVLDDALACLVPDSRMWERKLYPSTPDTPAPGYSTYYIEVSSPFRRNGQSLVVQLRHDGDIQVEYHIEGDRRNSFETFFVLPEGQERDAIEGIAGFVSDILAERLVLVRTKGIFGGERRYLKPGSLTESDRRDVRSITSWLGTFDWSNPG
jgi:hypothetical protein